MYSKRMRDRLLKKNRLERTKDVLKATAVIGRTLKDAFDSMPKPDTTGQPSKEPFIEGDFRVVKPESEAEEAPTWEPGKQQVEVTIIAPPAPDKDEPAHNYKEAPSQPADDASTSDSKQRDNSGQQTKPPPESEPEFSIPISIPPELRQWSEKLFNQQAKPEASQNKSQQQYKGQFLEKRFTNAAGTRSYKLYVPSSYNGQALPLVVMLHGCTQSPDEFAASTRMNKFAEEHSFFVAYPAQTRKANLGKCWNWFKASEQQRDQGEPAIIAGMTQEIINSYSLDSRQVYVAGISAGGAMAMVMGTTYPDLFAAVGVQSGVPYGVAHNILSGLAAIKKGGAVSVDRVAGASGGKVKLRAVPTIVFHGDEDSFVHPDNGDQIIAQWMEVLAEHGRKGPQPQVTVDKGQVPGGHAYTRSVYHDENGLPMMEQWLVHGAGHAWSGGDPNIAWTDGQGPDASQEMLRFFYAHSHPGA